MTPDHRCRRVALARAPGIGPVTYRKLWSRYGERLDDALDTPEEVAATLRLGTRAAAGLLAASEPRALETAARWLESLATRQGRVLLLGEPDFPDRLSRLRDAPPLLFVLGDPTVLSVTRALAIVGARRPDPTSTTLAHGLAIAAARQGRAVISGLALGVDGAAHRGALAAGGPTVAVVAGGPEQPFPPEHADLHAALIDAGAVVATEPPGTRTESHRLVRRNRWIAALADHVVVVEAGAGSGARHAAAAAREYSRGLFAVCPRKAGPRFAGNAALLAAGARGLNPDSEPDTLLEAIE